MENIPEFDFEAFAKEVIEGQNKLIRRDGQSILQGYVTPPEWKGIVQRLVEMRTPEETVAAADDVTLLESLLKHAHQFEEKAREYCILEARMYVRIASLYKDWDRDDRHRFREHLADNKTWRLVEWIKDKSDDDLAWVFGRVAEGRRLETVRKDEMAMTRKMVNQDKYAATMNRMVDSFKRYGKATVNVESFCDSFAGRGKVDAKTASVWVDQTRKEIRKLGGVGLGGGEGKYIALVDVDNDARRKEIAVAVLNRLQSIEHDLNRMGEICSTIGLNPPTKEIRGIIDAAEAMIAPVLKEEQREEV